MNIKDIDKKINELDPKIHKSLIDALSSKLDSQSGKSTTVRVGNGISSNQLIDIFNRAVDKINQQYVEGAIAYIERYHPYLDSETDKAEEKLNRVWESCNEGRTKVEEFEEALKNWYSLNLRNIEIYRKQIKKGNQNQ